IAYQWYYAAPGDATWTAVTDNAVYSGATTATLAIANIAGLNKYQYYCQVRESGASCYSATNATILKDNFATVWNGSWSNGTPDANKRAIINTDYNTSTQGDIDACSVTVNA